MPESRSPTSTLSFPYNLGYAHVHVHTFDLRHVYNVTAKCYIRQLAHIWLSNLAAERRKGPISDALAGHLGPAW